MYRLGHVLGVRDAAGDGPMTSRDSAELQLPKGADVSELCDYVPVDSAALDAAAYALHRDGYDEGDYIPEEADPEDFERAEVVLQGLREAGFDVVRRA